MATALITGASAGLGEEFAWQLAAADHDLVLVARDKARLEKLASNLQAAAGIDVEVLAADLGDLAELSRVADRIGDPDRPISLLINNAGFATGRFVTADIAGHVTGLDVMVRAVLVLSHAAGRAMRERGVGAILNVGSVAAGTTAGVYSAHKAWVQVFTEALACELADSGVTATVLRPGPVWTEFFVRAGKRRAYPRFAWLTAENVVATALADVRRGAVISTPSLRYRVASSVLRHVPRSLIRAGSRRQNGP